MEEGNLISPTPHEVGKWQGNDDFVDFQAILFHGPMKNLDFLYILFFYTLSPA